MKLFRKRDQRFERKLYDYDQPHDLAELLLEAGFTAETPESLMIADTAEVARALRRPALPAGVRLDVVTSSEGVEKVDALPTSRPILERVGFSCVATTPPVIWSPA